VYRGSEPRHPAREGSGAPRVLQLWILPLCRGGLQSASCPTVPDPASLLEGSSAGTAYLAVSCGPQDSNIKKSLAGLSVQLGSPVLNAHAHVCKTLEVRVIMGLQDVRADGYNTAIVQCRPC
jgi:hypothetical protein